MYENKEKLSTEQIRNKLIGKLVESGWASFLRAHLRSSEFESIIDFLINENQEGRRFTPALKQVFRAFEECPVDKVKVIMIGQDPYPQPLVADGVAFSCSNTNKAEASLRYILRAVENTVALEDRDAVDEIEKLNLVRWSHQGVLMLNSALTTEVGKVGKHVEQWKPFMEYLIDMLNFQQAGLIFVLMGKQAQQYEALIGDHHTVIKSTHPAYAAYMKVFNWDCNDIFNKINLQLVEYKKEKILW
jgi:uracil-DNA glycosylase